MAALRRTLPGMSDLVVGFDLDMTLVDSADGIVATIAAVCAAHGVQPDPGDVHATVGLPLDQVFPRWLPQVPYADALAAYRAHYSEHVTPHSRLLPHAAEAVAAARAHGARVVVITAKRAGHAQAVLDVVGLAVDEVVGERFAAGKAAALREQGVAIYIGDHHADVAAARSAGVVAVGVATGPTPIAELADADLVLPDLAGFPEWLDSWMHDRMPDRMLDRRLADLADRLTAYGSVLVAFSGGADSAFLLAAAARALGPDRVIAATAVSASLAEGELTEAAHFAAGLGVRHLQPFTDEMGREGYRANGSDRCYHCKSELLDVLVPLAAELGVACVATGTNADDLLAEFRPGIQAASERGARTPLADAGLTKAQIRTASRAWDLPTWDKPQAACLSSRIAYGLHITPAVLARVDRAEAALRAAMHQADIPVVNLRVRDLGDLARIEVDATVVAAVAALPAATDSVRAAGFARVEIDPQGFRSGSLNEALG